MNICMPGKYDNKNKTCFDLDELIELCSAYNRYIAKNGMKLNKDKTHDMEFIKIKSDKPYLLKELKSRFEKECHNDELCITKQKFMNEIINEYHDQILNKTFRKTGPDGSTEWLSNTDIDEIMFPYENVYLDFKFMGAVPSDCGELKSCSLYRLDYDNLLKKRKSKIGIIFNHDTHDEPGSHWVALYIDLDKFDIYYCDSTGHEPINNIKKIIDSHLTYCKNKQRKANYKINTKAYQTDGSECGIYSCNFLIRILSGESFDDIVKNSLNFKQINSCRNVYFNNNPSKEIPHKLCDPSIN
uniref:Ubiquitin-like protease family profile domain-containing protein n=1 Tax=viral metagenome TaxID=1070528 RepID=A0A6C0LT87_9ZZZZ